MGNTASRTGPGADLADLPDVVFKDTLGNGRFFKTSLCLHDEGGLVVVKSYRPPEGSFPNFGDLEQYEDQIVALRKGLAAITTTIAGQACPHVWPTQRVYHSDRGVHLVRQYFYSNLAARITSRPFLTTVERQWLAWQLLVGLEQAHQAGICHGDVKAENVLLTSWGWVFVSDFAPYKPVALPSDNPADFSFFFDTSGKRKCYLAPERFYDSLNTLAPPSALTPAMDVFSAGCVIAELFADGDALFDYSRLLAYRRGDYDPGDFLNTKCGPQIAEIIAHMIQTDPQARASAGEYAHMLASRTLDPAITATFHPFLASLLQTPDASHRARCVISEYEGLKSSLTGASDLDADPPFISNAPYPETQDQTDQESCVKAESIDTAKPALDDVFAETPVSNLYDEAMQMIADVKTVLSTIDKHSLPIQAASLKSDSRPSMQPAETQMPQDSPPPDITDTSKSSAPNDDNRLQGLGLLLGVLCATMRGARHESGRVKFVHFIADCAVNCGDDELRLQTAIPRLVTAATDSSFAAVRCAALASIPKVLGCVCRFPPGEIRSFADYLLPLLSLLPTDADVAVQTEYAATLGRLASIAHRVMDCDDGTCVLVTPEERAALRAAIERSVHDILVGVHPDPKLALLPHVSQLAVVLGRRDTADGLLPALLTLFNAREWQVRAALYEHGLQGVCPTLGPASVSFLLPFLDRMLSDPEPAAIAASLRLLTTLTDVGILGRRYILTAMKKVVGDCGLLSQPSSSKSQDPKQCTAVRTAALCFVASASQALGPITTRALLLPILTPALPSLDQLVRQGQGHEAALTVMDGASLARCLEPLAPSPAGSTGPFASPPPFSTGGPAQDHISRADVPLVSYSVSIDPATFRKGASLLDSALTLVDSSKPSSDKMALMLAGAQRTLVNMISEQQSQQNDTLQNERASRPMSGHSSATRERENGGASDGKGTSAEETRSLRPKGVLVAHLAQHRGRVNRILPLSKKGQLFLTASEDGCIKIWDVGRLERDISFRARASYQGHGHASVHAAVVLERDGNTTVASADSCARVLFWNVNRLGGPDSTVNEYYDQYQFDKRLNITDLGTWSADCIVVSVAGPGGGVVALDVRNPGNTSTSYDVASSNRKRSWQLPCDPADGAVICLSLGDPEPSKSHWVVTATNRGVVALWDVRFLLPVVKWSIPTGARIEALAVKQGSTLTSAPTVYTAAGRNEISAWDVNRRSCVGVYRYNSISSLTTVTEQNASTKSPEALSVATGSSLLARSMDPLAKGRLLGANELRSLPPRSPGVRALLLDDGPENRLFAGGSDCAVRCWDLLNPTDHSYCVVAPPPAEPFTGPPMFEYSCKLLNEVPVVEEGCQLNRPPSQPASSQRQQQLEAQTWWERASGLCHKQTITAMARLEGHSEALLATASMDGVVKDAMRWVGGLKPPSSAVRVVTGRVATGRVLSKNKLSSKQMKIYCTDGQLNPSGSEESFGIPSQLQAGDLPTQGDAAVAGIDPIDYINRQLQDILKPPSTEDYLAEFMAISNNHPRNIGFFGTRNMPVPHQQLIEVLAYAIVLTGNHVFTSGATGTNAAVIRGALRAENPDLLTVVLPQSLHCQPSESQDLLGQVQNVIEMPDNDDLPLLEASRICNRDIVGRVQQVLCVAFHDSSLLLETCQEARNGGKLVTLFYLD